MIKRRLRPSLILVIFSLILVAAPPTSAAPSCSAAAALVGVAQDTRDLICDAFGNSSQACSEMDAVVRGLIDGMLEACAVNND